MDGDMNLNINITDNGTAVSTADHVNISEASIAKLESAIESLTAGIAPLNSHFADFEGAVTKAGQAAQNAEQHVSGVGSAARGAGSEVERATAVFGPLGGAIADASEHARLFTMAFTALGLETAASIEKVSGLGQFLTGLGNAAPQIIAVGAAIGGLAVAFEVVKNAVEAASDLEASMNQLGQAVRNQGGDWAALSATVKQFADDQERTTIFSNVQVIQSINKLVESGASLKDAMTIVRVAEDAAAGSGRSLEEVTNALMEAEHGRTTVLASLGIATRAQIKDGMDFDTVLSLIEQHMGGAATNATETYKGSITSLGASFEHINQDIGEAFLPLLTDVARDIVPIVDRIDSDLQPALKSFSAWAKSEGPEISSFFGHVKDVAGDLVTEYEDHLSPAVDRLGKDFNTLYGDLTDAQDAAKTKPWDDLKVAIDEVAGAADQFSKDMDAAVGWLHQFANDYQQSPLRWLVGATPLGMLLDKGDIDVSKGLQAGSNPIVAQTPFGMLSFGGDGGGPLGPSGHGFTAAQQAQEAATRAELERQRKAQAAASKSTTTDFNPQVGGGAAKTPTQSDLQMLGLVQPTAFTTSEKAAQAADAAVKALGITEQDLTGKMNAAGTMTEYLADKQKLYEASVTGTEAVIAKLQSAHVAENNELATLNSQVVTATTHYNALAQQYDTAAKALNATNNPSKQQVEHVKQLKEAADEAKKSLDTLTSQQTKIAGALSHTNDELAKQKTALAALQNQIPTIQREWQQFTDDQASKTKQSIATIGMSTAQLYAYYKQEYDDDYAAYVAALNAKNAVLMGEILPKMKAAYQQANTELVQIYQQDYNNRKQWLDKATTEVENFVDQIVTSHKSMRDILKSIYDDILKAFIEMCVRMIAESSLVQGALGWLGGLMGIPGMGASSAFAPGTAFGPGGQGVGAGVGLGAPAIASATSGASSYGLLGAFLGSSGASQVIAALSSNATAATSAHGGSSAGGGGAISSPMSEPGMRALASMLGGGGAGGGAGGSGSSASAAISGGSTSSARGAGSIITGGGSTVSYGSGGYGGVGSGGVSPAFAGGAATGGSGGGLLSSLGLGSFVSDYHAGSGGSAPATSGNYGGGSSGGGVGGGVASLTSGLKVGGLGLGSLLGVAGGGALLGSLATGNKGFSALGGGVGALSTLLAIGSILGPGGMAAMLTQPLGWAFLAGGALLGALVGSLFGDHFNQADEPDIYQQGAWGQENADMQGSTGAKPMMANGKAFTMDSWTSSQTSNKGWNVIFEQFVSQFRNNSKVLSQDLQLAFPDIESLWGGAQNQSDFNSDGKNGYLSIGSGKSALWSTFWNYVVTYGPAIAQLMQMYTASDLYSASLSGSASQIGAFTPSGSPNILHEFPDVGVATDANLGAAFSIPGGASAPITNINVYQQFGGSLLAERAMNNRMLDAIAGMMGFPQNGMQGLG